MIKHKLKAAGVHLLISLLVALVSLILVFFVWYPAPLYQATGVVRIFLIVLGIDLVLGPLLTFIVYKPNKRTLKFDLTVIVLLQLTAFVYGFYHVYDGRPAWIAYNVDRFDLVKNNEIDTRKLTEASAEYQQVSSSGAKYVAAVIPTDDSEIRNEILFDEIGFGVAPSQRPELYQPLSVVEDNITERAKPIDELYDYNDKAAVDKALAKYPEADNYLPLKANAVDMVVLINTAHDNEVIEIVDLRPWE